MSRPRRSGHVQRCPFCGAEETDRVDLEGRRFLVFACLFTPEVDPALGEDELRAHLQSACSGPAPAYFQGICDRLHRVVTRPGSSG